MSHQHKGTMYLNVQVCVLLAYLTNNFSVGNNRSQIFTTIFNNVFNRWSFLPKQSKLLKTHRSNQFSLKKLSAGPGLP